MSFLSWPRRREVSAPVPTGKWPLEFPLVRFGEHYADIWTLADAAHEGLRLSDVMRSTGLSNGTTHRLLEGLVEHGLADLKADSGRYFLGMKIFSWSKSASNRFGLAERVAPALQRLADQTNDTAYFMLRVDDDSLCLDCREGNFPIKTISVRVGNRWPLGVGAGGLALLAFLPDNDIAQIIRDHRIEREKFGVIQHQQNDEINKEPAPPWKEIPQSTRLEKPTRRKKWN